VRAFLDDYFRGKTLVARRRRAFAWMIGFQYVAVACDAAALYAAFLALGALQAAAPAPGAPKARGRRS
jgi:hypothetical protein